MPRVNVNGLRMYFEFQGEGEPLLLIMGLGADHALWKPVQVPAFTEAGYRCVLFDNRDVGQTDASPTPQYTMRDMADDTAGLLEALDLGPVHVLGASMGGMIAQELAISHRQLVRSLTLVSTLPRIDAITRWILQGWKAIRPKCSMEEYFMVAGPWGFTYRFFEDEEAVQMATRIEMDSAHPQAVEGFVRHCEATLTHDAADRLASITTPTHVLAGEEDILTGPRYARALVQSIPDARLSLIPASGHWPFWENPDACHDAIVAFLKAR